MTLISPPLRAKDLLEKPNPIFWADGITQVDELDDYRAAGMNTVVVRLTWSPSPDGTLFANDLEPQKNFAREAAKRGMNIIYALPPSPTGEEFNTRVSPYSKSYVTIWSAWIQAAMASLKDTPNLMGWMLPDDPRGLKLYDDSSLGDWLEAHYASVQALDKQWREDFHSFDDVTLQGIAEMVEKWQGFGAVTGDLTMDEVYARVKDRDRVIDRTGWAFHPAALVLAQYKCDLYRGLLTTWVGVIKANDPNHLIISGRTPDYAQLLALPPGIDISMPDLANGRAESDIVTHNPQSIDIARRGGRFRVLPMLSPEANPEVPLTAMVDLVPRWIQEACSRGATGVAFGSWPALRDAEVLKKAVGESLTKLQTWPYSTLWNHETINTTAVMLTPLADGATVNFGTPPVLSRRGLYGFADDLVRGEPSDLVWALRWGTTYGGVDYISPEDLVTAPLDRYATMLMPQALSVSNENAARLGSYVANGGVLLADLGMGAIQNGYQVDGFSPTLAAIFGVTPSFQISTVAFNLNGYEPHRLFTSWAKPISMRPGLVLTAGDGTDGAAFDGPVAFSPTPPNGTMLAIGPQFNRPFRGTQLIMRSPVSIHELGNGAAVFAPFRLWNHWRPGHFGFDNFHGDLFGRGVLAAVVNKVPSLVPLPRFDPDGATNFPELLNHTDGLVLANHSAPGLRPLRSIVQTSGTGDWLWRGGIVSLPNSNDNPMTGGRPAPAPPANELEGRSRPVLLYTALKPGDFEFLSMRPIAVQNLAGGPIVAQITEESPEHLRIHVWPGSPNILERNDGWQPVTQDPSPVRITVVSAQDGYAFQPGSSQRVMITDYAKAPDKKGKYASEVRSVTATPEGRLVFEFTGSACEVDITPLTAGAVSLEKKRK